jgi:uncharacterized YokU family protein
LKCVWCDNAQAMETTKNCQWIEPGGSGVITVNAIPAIECPQCHDVYLVDDIYAEVEAAINTVDLSVLGDSFSYEALMKAPRLNIFDMYKRGDSFNCH